MADLSVKKIISEEGDAVATVELPSENFKVVFYLPKNELGDPIDFSSQFDNLLPIFQRVWELGKKGEELNFKEETIQEDQQDINSSNESNDSEAWSSSQSSQSSMSLSIESSINPSKTSHNSN